MKKRQPRLQMAAFVSTFVLSTALVGSAAVAQQQQPMRGSQAQPQRQPHMMGMHDDVMANRIEIRLARSSSLSGTDITVSVQDRVATLSGTVGSEQEKERAMRLTRKVRGVQDVKSDLRIDQEAVEQRRNVEVEDDVLEKRVATKLADEIFPLAEVDEGLFGTVEVDGYNWEFEVEADEGIVTLDGSVDSYGDITEAVTGARGIPGVKAVVSDLWVDRYDYLDPYGNYPYYHPYRYPYGYYR